MNLADYDTTIECQQQNGVWVTSPAPLCYLPVNDLPAERVILTQEPVPSNAGNYALLQHLCTESIRVGGYLYLVIWACGIFSRMIKARL